MDLFQGHNLGYILYESGGAGVRPHKGQPFADPSADAAQKHCDQRAKQQMEEARPHEIFQDKGVEVPHAARR